MRAKDLAGFGPVGTNGPKLVGSDIDLMRDVYMTSAQREAYDRIAKDAERYRFCVSLDTMPVIAMDGKTWCMFVAVKGGRRSLFTGATPSDAIDAAMQGANA